MADFVHMLYYTIKFFPVIFFFKPEPFHKMCFLVNIFFPAAAAAAVDFQTAQGKTPWIILLFSVIQLT